MAEKKIVYKDQTLTFEGLFNMKELFRTVTRWLNEHGYDMFENKNYEEVYEKGKKLIFEFYPYKKVTDYHKLELRIFAVFENLEEVNVEIKGVKQRLLKGAANFTFDATLITDYENRWEGRPVYYFYRTLVDKFVYKSYTDKYENMLVDEAKQLKEEVKAYLNMFRYQV